MNILHWRLCCWTLLWDYFFREKNLLCNIRGLSHPVFAWQDAGAAGRSCCVDQHFPKTRLYSSCPATRSCQCSDSSLGKFVLSFKPNKETKPETLNPKPYNPRPPNPDIQSRNGVPVRTVSSRAAVAAEFCPEGPPVVVL